ncbi:MAG: hypothetical protein ACRELD_12975, partial [Longimicrobiales bacterium]
MPSAGRGQARVMVEAAAAHARPPGGTVAESASYGTGSLGLRLGATPALELIGYGGAAVDRNAGSWIGGVLGLELHRPFGRVTIGGRVAADALSFTEPFEYGARTVSVQPSLRWYRSGWIARLDGELVRGNWDGVRVVEDNGGPPLPLPFPGPGTTTEPVEGDLALTGGAAELTRRVGAASVGVLGTSIDATNGAAPGRYSAVGVRAGTTRGDGALSARALLW